MWAIVFVGAVAASNAVMLLKVEEEKLREADRMSMWASLGAWVLVSICEPVHPQCTFFLTCVCLAPYWRVSTMAKNSTTTTRLLNRQRIGC